MPPQPTVHTHPWFSTDSGVVAMCHHGHAGRGVRRGSLRAYLDAYRLGYRWFQVDVVPTTDDLISMHAVLGRHRRWSRCTTDDVRRELGDDVVTLRELLEHPELRDARWNVEVKSRSAVPALWRTLQATTAVSRVMISAPYHPSIQREARDRFGALVAIAAPGVFGGALGLRLAHPRTPYDAVQVHRWFAARAKRRSVGYGAPVQSWTIGDDAALGRCLTAECLPIVGRSDEATVAYLRGRRVWASFPTPPAPDPEPEPEHRPAPPDRPITALLLGGGGWRGAFGSIGAVAYLVDAGRWGDVEQVVSISGGGFVAGRLCAEGVDDADPAPVLARLMDDLIAQRGPFRRALVLAALPLPAAVFPPLLLQVERRLLTWQWCSLLRRVLGDGPPRGEGSGGRRYVLCAAGRSSGVPHFFVAGGEADATDPPAWGVVVGPGWTVTDAVRSTTALPWIDGYRTPDLPGFDGPGSGRGEVLIDGGVTGIFGRQYLDRPRWLTSPTTDPRTLVVDAGRSLRRNRRLVDRLTGLSAVALLSRWVQIALETGFRTAVDQAWSDGLPDPTGATAPKVLLARIAETDEADHHSTLGLHDEVFRRLEHGRRLVGRFGLAGLDRRHALTTIAVAVVACAVDVEPPDQRQVDVLEGRLRSVGGRLGVGDELAEIWRSL